MLLRFKFLDQIKKAFFPGDEELRRMSEKEFENLKEQGCVTETVIWERPVPKKGSPFHVQVAGFGGGSSEILRAREEELAGTPDKRENPYGSDHVEIKGFR